MKNIELNAGGLIGALVCGGGMAAIVYSNFNLLEVDRGKNKLIITSLIGGAFAGNFLWGMIFKKSEQLSENSISDKPEIESAE